MNSLFYGGYYYGSGFSARYLKKNLRDEIWENPKFKKALIQKWKKDPKYDPERKAIPAGLLVRYYYEIPQIREYVINYLADYEDTYIDPETGKVAKQLEVMKTVSINPIKTTQFNPNELINVFKPQAEQSRIEAFSKMQDTPEGPKDFISSFKTNFLEKMKDVPNIPVEGFFAPEKIKKEPSESILGTYTFDQLVRYVSENIKDKGPYVQIDEDFSVRRIDDKLFSNIINCIKKNRAKRIANENKIKQQKLRKDKFGKILYDIRDYVEDQIKKYEDVALSFIEISQDEGVSEDIIEEITSVITEEVNKQIIDTVNEIRESTPESGINEPPQESESEEKQKMDIDVGEIDIDDLVASSEQDNLKRVIDKVLNLVQQLHQYLGLPCPSKIRVKDFTTEEVYGHKLSDLQIIQKYLEYVELDQDFEDQMENIKIMFGGCNLKRCPKKRNLRNYY